MLEHIVFVFIIVVSLYFIYTQYYGCKEAFTNYLNIASKCFSCENELPDELKWMGQPAKCFDCQNEYRVRYGPNSVYSTTQQKTFEM